MACTELLLAVVCRGSGINISHKFCEGITMSVCKQEFSVEWVSAQDFKVVKEPSLDVGFTLNVTVAEPSGQPFRPGNCFNMMQFASSEVSRPC